MITNRTTRTLAAASALAALITLPGAVTGVPAALAAAPASAAVPSTTGHPNATAARAGSTRLDRATVVGWVERYLRAWKDKDDVAVGKLFTRDAVYQEVPGDDSRTFVGREAIRKYWRGITKGQSQVTTRYGEPVIQGDRAAVELWITLKGGGKWMTIIETNVMTFDRHGQVSRNAEYWTLRQGKFAPPRGWGSGS
ncbi:nuclear transport factor 2 family protein [Nonomuraea candida]|uniref:nuclear transport factor 2 family protein n=1 Tax=Nonomuraea candida TaxID=359159 RepID=UPI0006933714|nr:nuclear transport factor 2 family protein [Nonomuraea candida]